MCATDSNVLANCFDCANFGTDPRHPRGCSQFASRRLACISGECRGYEEAPGVQWSDRALLDGLDAEDQAFRADLKQHGLLYIVDPEAAGRRGGPNAEE